MARSNAVACTLAVCFVLCAGRVVEISQDDQQFPQPGNTEYDSLQSDFTIDSTQPLIRVTVWRTAGIPNSKTWETLSSVITDPLSWMSSRLPDQSIATSSPLDPAADLDFQDMLRRVSCARMRQAMIDYYNYRQGLAPTVQQLVEDGPDGNMIRLIPLRTPFNLGSGGSELRQYEDTARVATFYDFPLRGSEGMSAREEYDANTDTTDLGFTVFGNSGDSAAGFDQQVDEYAAKRDALRSAGVQQLSSMLHTVSGLLAKPVQDSDTQQQTFDFGYNDVTGAEQSRYGGPVSEEEDSYLDDTNSADIYDFDGESSKADRAERIGEFASDMFVSEPGYVKSAEPIDGTDAYTDVYEDPSYSKADAVDAQPWDTVTTYYGDEYVDNDEFDFDWGLFVFTLLSALCVVVWAVAVTQYVKLRAMFCRAEMVCESDSVLAPLLEKVRAVEVAAQHVDPDQPVIDTKTALLKAEYCPANTQV